MLSPAFTKTNNNPISRKAVSDVLGHPLEISCDELGLQEAEPL